MVSYSAVVLDESSRQRLLDRFGSYIPEGWEVIAHHMTINMGEISPDLQEYLGMTVELVVEDIAMDDKVMAVGVSGFYTKNEKPHITLAVNRTNGGKPFLSNKLQDWSKVKPLFLKGKVIEVER